MLRIRRTFNIDHFLISLLTTGIIFFGPGRLLMFGPITGRYILLGLIVFRIISINNGRVRFNNHNSVLFLMIIYFTLLAIIGITQYSSADVISEYGGYATIIICPYFILYFSEYPEKVVSWIRLFRKCAFILAIIQIIIYIHCVIKGASVYPTVNGFLKSYDIGFIDFFGSGLAVRVYLKGAVSLVCALMFEEQDIIKKHDRMKALIRSIVLGTALITTFSAAIYAFSIMIFLAFGVSRVNRKYLGRVIIGFIIALILIMLFVQKTNILNNLMSRYAGNYNAFGYRFFQIIGGLDEWSSHPLFGTGFGKPVKVSDGIFTRYTHVFEVMWVQLLVHTGVLGFLLLISHIFLTVKKLEFNAKKSGESYFTIFKLWILYLCLVSFTNPYMNGSVGLGFYAIITGIAHMNVG